MRLWRLYHKEFTDALSGEGARRFGGRWNPRGVSTLYLADTPALAMLEVLARAPGVQRARGFVAAEVEIDGRRLPAWRPHDLPNGWDAEPAGEVGQAFGMRRFEESHLGFRVPSVIVPLQMIAVINTRHPDFATAVTLVRDRIPFPFDQRLVARH